MKTWYGVLTTFSDTGVVRATIVKTVDANKRPENIFVEKETMDIYLDWFDSRERAERFANDAENA